MGRWSIAKEMEDASSGIKNGRAAASSGNKPGDGMNAAPAQSNAAADAQTVDKGSYARGGYVAAHASGKRDYLKGKK